MDKFLQINFRKVFKITKPGDESQAVIEYRNVKGYYWYEGYSQDQYQIRVDLWIIVFYIYWKGKKSKLD